MRHVEDTKLFDYLDGNMEEKGQDSVEIHCAKCMTCAERLAQMRTSLEKFDLLMESFSLDEYVRNSSRIKILSEKLKQMKSSGKMEKSGSNDKKQVREL